MPASRAVRRTLCAVLLVGTAVLSLAAPVGAAKPSGGGTTTRATVGMTLTPSTWVVNNPGCAFDATYTWSTKTRGANIVVKLYDRAGNVVANTPLVQNVPASGEFTFIFNFKGGATGSPTEIYARGVLTVNGVEVSGTAAVSPVTSESCSGPIYVSWLSSFSLT